MLAGELIGGQVARRVAARAIAGCERGDRGLEQVLFESVYREQQRLAAAGAEGDPRYDRDVEFVRWLRRALARADEAERQSLLRAVIAHYTDEIAGHFDPRVYGFATRVLPPALGALLHGGKPTRRMLDVRDRVAITGEVDALRAAARAGTVVLVPTHVSNLDAVLLGYAIYALGLPPVAYGAGLNLFTSRVTGYFMRNLGAFTVDRKKTDPLYRAAVKEYMTVLLERGQPVLFFPGGTRSRSGAIERRLKLGFLGTAVTAFGNRAQSGGNGPVFVVPCTLSYPLVLEASSLIEQYLRAEGGPQFVDVRDEFEQPERWYDFLRQLAQLDVRVHVRFGRPLDFVGNPIDERGISYDPRGRPLDAAGYLRAPHGNGALVADAARDAEYTRALAGAVVASFRREAVAMPSSVLAFAAFERLRRGLPQLDIFRLLRVLGPHAALAVDELRPDVDALLSALGRLEAAGAIRLAPELQQRGAAAVFEQGADTLARYHRVPALRREGARLQVGDPTLLLYYRNRLDGYGLPAVLGMDEIRARGRTGVAA